MKYSNALSVFALALLLVPVTGTNASNLVVNGDFEINSAVGSQFNVSNAQFSMFMDNTAAFGTSDELDIVLGTDFGIAAQSGDWKVGLHQNIDLTGNFDAFSMDLTTALVAGQLYRLNFFGVGENEIGVPSGEIEIGVSSVASVFGTGVFTGTPDGNSTWTNFIFEFVAPADASYLTVRVGMPEDAYAFVDNFNLTQVPLPGALVLMGWGLLGLGLVGRKRSL